MVVVYDCHKVHPLCAHKLTKLECMYWSNTTLFDGSCMYSIYYTRYNYMFRRLTMAIFRLFIVVIRDSSYLPTVHSPQ